MGTGAPGCPKQRLAQLGQGEGSAGCPGNGLLLRQRVGLTHTSGVPEARAGWDPCSAWDPRPRHPRQAELGTTRPCRSVLAPAAGSSLHTCPGTGREDSGCPPSPTPAGNVGGGRLPCCLGWAPASFTVCLSRPRSPSSVSTPVLVTDWASIPLQTDAFPISVHLPIGFSPLPCLGWLASACCLVPVYRGLAPSPPPAPPFLVALCLHTCL